jgi:glycosyltransferase involved in cell wall biosynthesis
VRVLVHDYSGHPFQVQLSRALAARGLEVLHLHCPSYRTGKGALTRRAGDPATFSVEPVPMAATWDRYSWGRRVRQELTYGADFTRRAAAFRPDVVLSSNDPLFAKTRAAAWCRRSRTPWVFWLQDVYSIAMANQAERAMGPIGRPAGRVFQGLERRLLKQAAAVVAITEDFLPVLHAWGVDLATCEVIENWAPLEELPLVDPRDRSWRRQHHLPDGPLVLYSGTLGLKHDPGMLVELARGMQGDSSAAVVVVSEGPVADRLAADAADAGLSNLHVLPYEPFDRLPAMLAAADVLVALLEPSAGVFSVPSKVLTYFCAGRAIVGAIPASNLAAKTIVRAGAGEIVAPHDRKGFVEAVLRLLEAPETRRTMGASARAYAERTFDLDAITDRFLRVLQQASRGAPVGAAS